MKNNRSWWSSGQSLVEVTVATTALVFGLVAIISSVILAVRNSSVSNNQAIATQDAQEVVEIFRKYERQLGWESFYAVIRADGVSMTYCLITLPATSAKFAIMPVGNCTVSASYTGFVRQAAVTVDSPTQITVNVTVTWRDGTTTRSAVVKQIFRNFR